MDTLKALIQKIFLETFYRKRKKVTNCFYNFLYFPIVSKLFKNDLLTIGITDPEMYIEP